MANPYDYITTFNAYKRVDHPSFNNAIDYLLEEIASVENRKRARRGENYEDFRSHLEAIISNLYSAWSIAPKLYIPLPLGKDYYNRLDDRYEAYRRSQRHTSNIIQALNHEKLDYIEFIQGKNFENFRRYSRIRAKKKLIKLLEKDFGLAARFKPFEFETIRLKDKNKRLIGYADTPRTKKMRANCRKINKVLASHFVFLAATNRQLDKVNEIMASSKDSEKDKALDISKFQLYRVFNDGSWELGGRFYGGWWQSIPSEYRALITIDGQRTVELDYSSFHPTMLYHKAAVAPPLGDMYALEGYDPEKYREKIKTAFNRLINTEKGERPNYQNLKPLPKGKRPKDLFEDLKVKHKSILGLLENAPSKTLMYWDSRIAEIVIMEFVKKDKVVLPVHDSFIVKREDESLLKETMARAYKTVMKKEVGIDKKGHFTERVKKEFIAQQANRELKVGEADYHAFTQTLNYELPKSGVISYWLFYESEEYKPTAIKILKKHYSKYVSELEKWRRSISN